MNCHCQSGKTFGDCCEPYIKGDEAAPTPEALMRSRYSAFCVKDIDYVQDTTDPQADVDRDATFQWMSQAEFFKLEVLKSSDEGNKGTVEFKAHYRMNGEDFVHHELSKFRKSGGVWYFRDGRVVPQPQK